MDVLKHVAAAYPIATSSTLIFYILAACLLKRSWREKIVPRFTHPISPQQSSLSSLDALRGFAAAYVALGHCWHWTYPTFYQTQLTVPALGYAAKAVPMFALLSGFLIYRSVRQIETREDARYYIARRLLRIYPLYLVSVAACLAFGQLVSDNPEVGTVSYLVAELMMFRTLGFLQFANPVTWSLYVELAFYVFLPLFVMCVGLRRILPVSIAILLLLVIADQVPGREFQLWKYFFAGIIASELALRWRKKLEGPLGTSLALLGAALLIIDLGGPNDDWINKLGIVKHNTSEYTLGLGLSFALLTLSLPFVRPAAAILDTFAVRFIGVISYSIFIVHPFYLLANFPALTFRHVGQQTDYFRTLEPMPDWYLPFVFAPGILLWAALLFLLVERPALAAGSRLIQRRMGRNLRSESIAVTTA